MNTVVETDYGDLHRGGSKSEETYPLSDRFFSEMVDMVAMDFSPYVSSFGGPSDFGLLLI
jgi:hypothetical protein